MPVHRSQSLETAVASISALVQLEVGDGTVAAQDGSLTWVMRRCRGLKRDEGGGIVLDSGEIVGSFEGLVAVCLFVHSAVKDVRFDDDDDEQTSPLSARSRSYRSSTDMAQINLGNPALQDAHARVRDGQLVWMVATLPANNELKLQATGDDLEELAEEFEDGR